MRRSPLRLRIILAMSASLCLIITLVWAVPFATHAHAANATATLDVLGNQWGVSSCAIGATEGDTRFNVSDLQDLGINTFRIYGGMSRWEQTDDSSTYGTPTIAQIQANPNVINWGAWDTAMTSPPSNSDYAWSASSGIWQGNARTIFAGLKSAGIQPVVTLRDVDNFGNPAWQSGHNPPTTTNDWNEWWEHVFATGYWLNVRNNYHVDDYEIHNEPDFGGQGWGGTEAQYWTFAQYTHDAIDYLYKTYLPGRTYHLYGPVSTSGYNWVNDGLTSHANTFDSIDYHNYNTGSSFTAMNEAVHGYQASTGHTNYPIWLSEWGGYNGNVYSSPTNSVAFVNNLISASSPGNDYVYGLHLFSMYDWVGSQPFQGLVDGSGNRTSGYYAMRLAIRALQGCKPTYHTITSTGDLNAITTQDSSGNLYLLVTNSNANNTYTVTANLSGVLTNAGSSTLYQYDSAHNDTSTSGPAVSNGITTLTVPATGVVLLKVAGAGTPNGTSVDDSVTGSGTNQFNYVGTWPSSYRAGCYGSNNHYSNTAGDTTSFTFSGSQVTLYSSTDSVNGIMGVTVDGGIETPVDTYGGANCNSPVYTSPLLSAGTHTIKVRVTGNKNPNATNSYIAIDRAVVSNPTFLDDSTTGSGTNQFNYSGTWPNGGRAGCYGGANHYSNTTGDTTSVAFIGTGITLYSSLDANNGIASVSIDGGPATLVDTYGAGQCNVPIYASSALASGSHTMTVRVTGTKNANAAATYIAIDRADILP